MYRKQDQERQRFNRSRTRNISARRSKKPTRQDSSRRNRNSSKWSSGTNNRRSRCNKDNSSNSRKWSSINRGNRRLPIRTSRSRQMTNTPKN